MSSMTKMSHVTSILSGKKTITFVGFLNIKKSTQKIKKNIFIIDLINYTFH